MKVYVVLVEWATTHEDCDFVIKVFETFEKAKEFFDKRVKEEKKFGEIMQLKNCKSEETETKFEIWEDGNFCNNNFKAVILEREVI